MRMLARILGTAVLSAALLNASAGLCFCHRGPDGPVSRAGHSCCLPSGGGDDVLAMGAAESCCHIEAAQRDMTPVDAIQLQAPPMTMGARLAPAGGPVLPVACGPAEAPSPPIQVLRL